MRRGVHDRHHRGRRAQQRVDEVFEQPVRTTEADEATVVVLLDGDPDPHRQTGRSCSLGCPHRIVAVAHHLHRDHVGAGLRETFGLGGEQSASLGLRPLVEHLTAIAAGDTGTHHRERAGNGHRSTAGLARQPHRGGVDHADVVVATDVVEQQRARRVGVGDQHLGTGSRGTRGAPAGRSRDASGWRRHTTCRRSSARRAPAPTCRCRHRE